MNEPSQRPTELAEGPHLAESVKRYPSGCGARLHSEGSGVQTWTRTYLEGIRWRDADNET